MEKDDVIFLDEEIFLKFGKGVKNMNKDERNFGVSLTIIRKWQTISPQCHVLCKLRNSPANTELTD